MNGTVHIVGAGVAGLTLGIALAQRDIECEIYERADEVRETGAGITLQSNAMTVMETMGLAGALNAEAAPLEVGELWDSRGRLLQRFAMDNTSRPAGIGIHRQRLIQELLEACPVPVHTGKAAVRYEQDSNSATVYFEDGTHASGATVVGCDGLHSRIREQMLGPTQLVYAGYTTWRGLCSTVDAPAMGTCEIWGPGTRFGIVPVGHSDVYWFAVQNTDEGGEDGPHPTVELLQIFDGFPDPVESLLRATADEAVIRTDTHDRDPVSKWADGRVAILGDAAHPMTPNMGQGAGQAIEDALALANALARYDVADALQAYERCRVERANQFVVRSRDFGRIAQMRSPLLRAVRDFGVRWTPDTLLNRGVDEMYTPVVHP